MDSLKFYMGPPCPNLLRPVDGPPLKRPYGCFWGNPSTGRAACGRLLPFWTPRAVRLWPGLETHLGLAVGSALETQAPSRWTMDVTSEPAGVSGNDAKFMVMLGQET
jgi:hypothetical protein